MTTDLPIPQLRPSDDQLAVAKAMLAGARLALMTVDVVLVPLVMPGKVKGVWAEGQPVLHPGGFWLASIASLGGPYDFARARRQCQQAAEAALARQPGTIGYAVIDEHGRATGYEGVRIELVLR